MQLSPKSIISVSGIPLYPATGAGIETSRREFDRMELDETPWPSESSISEEGRGASRDEMTGDDSATPFSLEEANAEARACATSSSIGASREADSTWRLRAVVKWVCSLAARCEEIALVGVVGRGDTTVGTAMEGPRAAAAAAMVVEVMVVVTVAAVGMRQETLGVFDADGVKKASEKYEGRIMLLGGSITMGGGARSDFWDGESCDEAGKSSVKELSSDSMQSVLSTMSETRSQTVRSSSAWRRCISATNSAC